MLSNPVKQSWKEFIMDVDLNEFFREATIRICGSLDIKKGLARCLDFLKDFMPMLP